MGEETATETRIARIRRGFEAFDDRDFGVLDQLCTPDLGFRDEIASLSGISSVRKHMGDWFGHLRDFHAELGESSDLGRVTVAEVHQTARLHDSESEIAADFTHVFVWDGDLISTWHIYADREQALATAGVFSGGS